MSKTIKITLTLDDGSEVVVGESGAFKPEFIPILLMCPDEKGVEVLTVAIGNLLTFTLPTFVTKRQPFTLVEREVVDDPSTDPEEIHKVN